MGDDYRFTAPRMKELQWKAMSWMLSCKCGSEQFAVVDISSRNAITADPRDFKLQCTECGAFVVIRGYQQ